MRSRVQFPTWPLDISEKCIRSIFRLSDREDRVYRWVLVKGAGKLCVGAVHRVPGKKTGNLFDVRARCIVHRSYLYLSSLSHVRGFLSLSLSLWSDHAVSALVDDTSASLRLQPNCKRLWMYLALKGRYINLVWYNNNNNNNSISKRDLRLSV